MKNAAFTLIELLVVVLIIGILAAIALPQYKRAVVKARVATILPVLRALSEAEKRYYLANGAYTSVMSELDVQTSGCVILEQSGKISRCGDFMVDISSGNILWGRVMASYCPGKAYDWAACAAARDFNIGFGTKHDPNFPNGTHCIVSNESTLGTWFCNDYNAGFYRQQ